ncbi:hypothetical protein ACWD3I_23010 [Streptomyces sp. NPDC002817]|uniref:hypothetical protein n=1 Tax=Streptomyces sp. NPDC088357 TaxID=3154655 RepID=UPI003442EC3E
MTAHILEKPVARRPETGWARARRLRGRAAVRTCVPAVVDSEGTCGVCPAGEGNIVRGED